MTARAVVVNEKGVVAQIVPARERFAGDRDERGRDGRQQGKGCERSGCDLRVAHRRGSRPAGSDAGRFVAAGEP